MNKLQVRTGAASILLMAKPTEGGSVTLSAYATASAPGQWPAVWGSRELQDLLQTAAGTTARPNQNQHEGLRGAAARAAALAQELQTIAGARDFKTNIGISCGSNTLCHHGLIKIVRRRRSLSRKPPAQMKMSNRPSRTRSLSCSRCGTEEKKTSMTVVLIVSRL